MISLLLPTRKRPVQLRRMIYSVFRTHYNDVEIILKVDDDDNSYKSISGIQYGIPIQVIYGPRTTLSGMWSELVPFAKGEIIGQLNDDVIFRTDGWDERIEKEFKKWPDHIVLVHGDDGYMHDALGTHPFVHRRWIDIQGFFTPPYFSSDFGDTWNNHIADGLGRRVYLPEIMIEHMHYINGKSEIDEITKERLERHERDNCDEQYWSKLPERVEIANRLGSYMNPPLAREITEDGMDFRGNSAGKCPECKSKSTVKVDRGYRHCNACGKEWQ